MNRKWTAVGVATVGIFALSANSCDEKGLGDADVGEAIEDERLVIVMPDTFPNFAVVCDGTTAVYAHTREAAPITVEDSVLCDGTEPDAKGVQEGEQLSESEISELEGDG